MRRVSTSVRRLSSRGRSRPRSRSRTRRRRHVDLRVVGVCHAHLDDAEAVEDERELTTAVVQRQGGSRASRLVVHRERRDGVGSDAAEDETGATGVIDDLEALQPEAGRGGGIGRRRGSGTSLPPGRDWPGPGRCRAAQANLPGRACRPLDTLHAETTASSGWHNDAASSRPSTPLLPLDLTRWPLERLGRARNGSVGRAHDRQ